MRARGRALRIAACAFAFAAALAWVSFQPSKTRAAADPDCSGSVETYHSNWPPVALVPSTSGGCPGYWTVSSDGGIFTFGGASFYGSTGALKLNKPIVAMAPTPDDGGYWLVASDGGVFTFGDATFFGSTGAMSLNKPIVGMASTPDGRGYWLVASDGGIFTFGDATFFGSTGAMSLNKPIVGMASTPDGGGYWLVASDGGIFTFGDATFFGSTGATRLNKPIVAMAPDRATGGYWLVASDGGVFSFDAPFLGSMGGVTLHRPVIAAADVDSGGYDMLGADGGVFTFGDAPYLGTAPGPPLAGTVIALDPGHDGGNASAPGAIGRPIWNGRTSEACDTVGSQTPSGYSEHEFNWHVAQYLAADLEAEGADVVLTRQSDDGVGPCVDQRAAIANDADADAAVSIHGDGGPPSGRGFTVLEPVADGVNNAIVGPSESLAASMRDAFARMTGEPVSDYYGTDGIEPRGDLGGLNLSTVPKVLIECANMQNANRRVLAGTAFLATAGRSCDRSGTVRLRRHELATHQDFNYRHRGVRSR